LTQSIEQDGKRKATTVEQPFFMIHQKSLKGVQKKRSNGGGKTGT